MALPCELYYSYKYDVNAINITFVIFMVFVIYRFGGMKTFRAFESRELRYVLYHEFSSQIFLDRIFSTTDSDYRERIVGTI